MNHKYVFFWEESYYDNNYKCYSRYENEPLEISQKNKVVASPSHISVKKIKSRIHIL